MAKRLRRDAQALVGTPVASAPTLAGVVAMCVDLPVPGGTKQYCVFDDGVLARYAGADLTIDVDNYRTTVDEMERVITDAGFTPARRRQDYSVIASDAAGVAA